MVKRFFNLDLLFGALSHPVRRDILQRGMFEERTIGQIAETYDITLAATSKHVKILENAQLITKHRRGKECFVRVSPAALEEVTMYLRHYEKLWRSPLRLLERYFIAPR